MLDGPVRLVVADARFHSVSVAKNSSMARTTSAGWVTVGTWPAPSIVISLLLGSYRARFCELAMGDDVPAAVDQERGQLDLDRRSSSCTGSRHSISCTAEGQSERITICLPQPRSASQWSSGVQALTNISMVASKLALQP